MTSAPHGRALAGDCVSSRAVLPLVADTVRIQLPGGVPGFCGPPLLTLVPPPHEMSGDFPRVVHTRVTRMREGHQNLDTFEAISPGSVNFVSGRYSSNTGGVSHVESPDHRSKPRAGIGI